MPVHCANDPMLPGTAITEVKGWKHYCGEDPEVTHLRGLPESVRVYEINGPTFFGMTDRITDISAKSFTEYLIIRMRGVPSLDSTGINALENPNANRRATRVLRLFQPAAVSHRRAIPSQKTPIDAAAPKTPRKDRDGGPGGRTPLQYRMAPRSRRTAGPKPSCTVSACGTPAASAPETLPALQKINHTVRDRVRDQGGLFVERGGTATGKAPILVHRAQAP